MFYDLHVHTTASDGEETPQAVVLKAIEAGLAGFAITDHDTVDGLEPARKFIEENRHEIEFIPGIELNTDYGDDEVHILGYFIDANSEYLRHRLSEIRDQRYARAEKIIAKLQNMGINIDFEQVKLVALGKLIGRPHIARVLCSNGYADSQDEAFQLYIERGRPAYVPRYKFLPAEAIALIKQAGGIAILAHPGLIKDQAKIHECIKLGIEGIEIFYPEHSEEQKQNLIAIAKDNNFLITGGSDFHGASSSETRKRLGAAWVDENLINRIREYYRGKIEKQ